MSKSFDVVRALWDVSLQFLSREAHALAGENGPSKSPLITTLARVDRPDTGRYAA